MSRIQGYEMIQKNVESDTGRGLCTYIKSGFKYREVKYETQSDECIAVEIKDNNDELYVFVNIYRGPNSTDDNSLKLYNFLLEVSETKKYKHKILCGDINYKEIDWQHMICTASVNSLDFSFLEATRDAYLIQHLDRPTMGRGSDKPSTLDLLLTDQEANIVEIQTDSPLGKSDHSLISAT